MTQCEIILAHLEAGGSLTVAEALQSMGVYALSQRIGELKRRGVPIKAERVETAGGATVARYTLARPQEPVQMELAHG